MPESVHETSIEPFDEACDPANPRSVKFQDVSAAAYKIRGGIVRTPCTVGLCKLDNIVVLQYSSRLSIMMGMDLYFKKEFLQVTGSFKERGARFAMMKMETVLFLRFSKKKVIFIKVQAQREKGVIAASAGNHALALSYHGKQLGQSPNYSTPTYRTPRHPRHCGHAGDRAAHEDHPLSIIRCECHHRGRVDHGEQGVRLEDGTDGGHEVYQWVRLLID